jgi:hypothetical protein
MTNTDVARLCAYEAILAFILKRIGAGPSDQNEIVALCQQCFPRGPLPEVMNTTVARLLSGDHVFDIQHHWPGAADFHG